MKRDKPFRINEAEKHTKHDVAVTQIQDKRAQREPCKPPCPQEKKVKK